METMILFAQTCLTAYLAGWLLLGVRDNILNPSMNETFTAEVLELKRLREDFPEAYEQIQARRVASRGWQRAAFRFIVVCETLACLLLLVAVAWMALALVGLADPAAAKTAAMAGALAFTSIWSGFLVVGNHFGFWYCHEWAQNTHFQLALWGTGAMIFLALG